MYIGKVAELTGASRKAIRLYEELGLLPPPERAGNYRLYTSHHLIIVSMIKRAQAVGFKLAELVPLMEHKRLGAAFPVEFARGAIDEKRGEIQDSIARLQAMDGELVKLKADLALLAS
ncbi:MAG TPA: MerR family transcriptional regulator [Pseudomonas sp.]|nr:MerR family transcriptional regulator [Pseudomonas sp.]